MRQSFRPKPKFDTRLQKYRKELFGAIGSMLALAKDSLDPERVKAAKEVERALRVAKREAAAKKKAAQTTIILKKAA